MKRLTRGQSRLALWRGDLLGGSAEGLVLIRKIRDLDTPNNLYDEGFDETDGHSRR